MCNGNTSECLCAGESWVVACQGLGSALLSTATCCTTHSSLPLQPRCEANLENSVLLLLLQAEEIVGGKYSKSWEESADPELPGGKRDLYLAGCPC